MFWWYWCGRSLAPTGWFGSPVERDRVGSGGFDLGIEGRHVLLEDRVELLELGVDPAGQVGVDLARLLVGLAFRAAEHPDQGRQLGVELDREVKRVLAGLRPPLD